MMSTHGKQEELAKEEHMKILLAVDDSKFSLAATEALISQTKPQGAEVRVLHVIEPIPVYPDGQAWAYDSEYTAVSQEQRKEAEGLVARTSQTLRDAGLKVTTAIEEGNPKVVIIDSATEWPADLIMVGSHGRKGLDRFFMGSVSEAVARHARCSVQIVRVPSH
jgi:nucleotide-binding universal stress UspA family protein